MNALDQLFKWLSPTLAAPKGTRRLSEPVPTDEDGVTVPLEGDEPPVDPPVGQDDRPDEPDGAGPVAV